MSGWIKGWVEARRNGRRPVNVQEFYEDWVEEGGNAARGTDTDGLGGVPYGKLKEVTVERFVME